MTSGPARRSAKGSEKRRADASREDSIARRPAMELALPTTVGFTSRPPEAVEADIGPGGEGEAEGGNGASESADRRITPFIA